ncbi:MAG: tetratricopeptide repeat protein [Phycisphaerales bacterium]|nr:tetratricopeptide repeat protein [Phycisphaerales bacterium]
MSPSFQQLARQSLRAARPALVALILTVGCTSGCASSAGKTSASTPIAPSASPDAKSVSTDLSALAERELKNSSSRGGSRAAAPPPVPGVEPGVLARRDDTDPHAFLSLDESLSQIATQMARSTPSQEPQRANVEPSAAAQALQLYARGRNAALNNRHLQAIVEFQKALQLDPASSQIWRELAHSYLADSPTSAQAVEAFEQLLALEPGNAEALFHVGLSAANRRDFARAIGLLGALRQGGQSSGLDAASAIIVDYSLSIALRELGYDRASIQAAATSLNIPESLSTWDRAANGSGRVSSSSDNLARLASVYRQRGETWRAIGDTHCRLGEYEKALDAYATSAALPSADPAALHPRFIHANLHLGRPFNAQARFLSALQLQVPLVTDRDIRLCAYLRENAQPVELLSQAVRELYHAHPDQSAYVRAAASLLPPDQAKTLLHEFINRRPRDLDGVVQLLSWVGRSDAASAVDLTISLATNHPDLTDSYADRLVIAVPQAASVLDAVAAAPPSAMQARIHARLLLKYGGLGEAWTVCSNARNQWPDDRGLAVQQLQLAAAMREHALVAQLLATAPAFEDVSSLLGVSQTHRVLGQTEQAVALARRAVELEPQNVEALIELARAQGAHAAQLASDPTARAAHRAQIDQAIALSENAIAAAPQRDEGYEVLALMYAPGGVFADTHALRLTLQRLRQANPNSVLYARFAAQDAMNQKRYSQALERLLALYDANPADSESLNLAVTAWQQSQKLSDANQFLESRLIERAGDSALLEQWARVQVLLNQADAAISRLQRDAQANARDFVARRLLEGLYRATGQNALASELGEQRLLARPQGLRREVELAALYAGAQRHDQAYERLEWVSQHADDAVLEDLAGAITIAGRIETTGADRDRLALDLVRKTIDRFPDAPLQIYGSGMRALARSNQLDAHFDELADMAVTRGPSSGIAAIKNDASIEAAQWESMAQKDALTWADLAQALVDDGHPAAAARAVRARLRAVATLENKGLALLTRIILVADATADAKNADFTSPSEHAARSAELLRTLHQQDLLTAALEGQPRVTLAQALYRASSVYSFVGGNAGAESLLRQSIELDPHNEMAMNNLGYMLLERDRNDPEVAQWIERAHQLDPREPNISDTIGWLRYKQGRFADQPVDPGDGPTAPGALTHIQQAIRHDPQASPEVFDHLGDVQWRLGNAQEAIRAWQQVLKMMDEGDFAQRKKREYQLIQRGWQLVVADPGQLYDREYGQLLSQTRKKLEAAEQGTPPPVAPTFDELKQ